MSEGEGKRGDGKRATGRRYNLKGDNVMLIESERKEIEN